MQTVREQLVEALECMEPLLRSFDNWCRIDRRNQCQSHLGDKPCSVVAARRAFNKALDRARAEPEGVDGCICVDCPRCSSAKDEDDTCACWEAGHAEGANEGHASGCNDDSCTCWAAGHQEGLEAQRERVG